MKGLKNFHKALCDLLKTESLFTDRNGELVIRTVIDKAWKTDHKLVKLLLSRSEIKQKFFDEISGHLVFNINTFIDYISDKNFLDNSYTRFRNKIGLNVNNKFLQERGEVSLVWPYKDCVLEGGQTKEEEKRREIFFNKILAQDEINCLFEPKVLTNWKRYTATGEEKISEIKRDENGLIKENLIIKGNNLLALHTLKKQFQGKIKLIYMDPPFNTRGAANTFLYNNSFNHSSWLTFMKNRLDISKNLLSKDGIVIIAIDHEELLYVGMLADEVFSRDNRIGIISVQTNPGGRSDSKFFATSSEFFLVYAKNKDFASIYFLPLTQEQKNDFKFKDDISQYRWCPFRRGGSNSTPKDRPNLFYSIFYNESTGYIGLEKVKGAKEIIPIDTSGVQRVWRQSKERFTEAVKKEDIRIKKNKKGYIVDLKDRIKKGRKPKTLWVNPLYDASSHGTRILKKILKKNNTFSYPKSKHLVKDIIKITTKKNDLILDFFGGSGTTAEVILELNLEDKENRQFILCEQMDYIKKVTISRILHTIKKNKKTNFIYCELMKYNEAYMDKIQEAKSSDDLLSLWRDISKNSFLNWYVNPETPEEAVNDFKEIGRSKEGLRKQKNLLVELLNKNQLYVNLSEIDDKNFNIREEDKKINKLFFQ